MPTDPTTLQDCLIHALGCVQAAHGCLLGSTIANAGLISDNLADAAATIKGIIKSMPNQQGGGAGLPNRLPSDYERAAYQPRS